MTPKTRTSARLLPPLACLVAVLLVPQGAVAAPGDAAQQQIEQLQQRQQQQIQKDLENARRAISPGGADLHAAPPPAAPSAPGACHEIRSIVIRNSPHLRPTARVRIEQNFGGRCLGVQEITEILGLVTKDYIEQGFIAARAYLPAQDLKQGTLAIDVVEGRIAGFEVDDKGAHSVPIDAAFPGLKAKILNLRDLEQGIDQINQLQSNNARLEIRPGTEPGDSTVVVHNEHGRPVHLFTSYDNQGQAGTGAHEASATLTLDNIAGLGEQLSYTQRQSVPFSNDQHRTLSQGLDLWLPHGYDTFTASAIHSSYRNVLTLPSGAQQPAEGTNDLATLGWSRVVQRDNVGRLSIGTSITSKDARNFFAGQFLDVSSRKLAVADLRTAYSRVLPGVGLLQGSLDYVRGLHTLGAMRDPSLLTPEQPHAQFGKLLAGVQMNASFQALGQRWSYTGEISAQKAYNSLYGSEKFLIGSFYTVNGFYNTSLSGDDGYYWRNRLALLQQLQAGSQVVNAQFYAALDSGRVWNVDPSLQDGHLSGAALGVQLQWRGVSLDVFRSAPISKPDTLPREPAQTWFRLSAVL